MIPRRSAFSAFNVVYIQDIVHREAVKHFPQFRAHGNTNHFAIVLQHCRQPDPSKRQHVIEPYIGSHQTAHSSLSKASSTLSAGYPP